ncbi:MAG TPA: T9SS type A sorting domain-containing protein [Bacteroidales bacterium]|nr:T9SS type A sorting domain-containing protein [Bacteroidales bacterium]
MKNFYSILFLCLVSTFIFGQTQTTRELVWDSQTRQYIEYIPTAYNSENPTPVMFCLHGLGDDMQNFHNSLELNQWGETANWIIITPQALDAQIPIMGSLGNAWNSGAGAEGIPILGTVILNDNVDDAGFLMAILDSLENNLNINTDSVFFMGFSLGGFMSNRMAIEHGDRITAIASVSGTIGMAVKDQIPVAKVNTLHFHGTNDETIAYEDAGFPIGGTNYSTGLGAEQTVDYWKTHNQCGNEATHTFFPDEKEDGLTFERFLYKNESENIQTALIKANNGIHDWYYTPVNDIHYSIEIYKFFTNTMDFPTDIKNTTIESLNIYPNPASDILFVSQDVDEIAIFDVTGKLVLKEFNNNSINISALNSGLYIVKTISEGKNYEHKIQIIK